MVPPGSRLLTPHRAALAVALAWTAFAVVTLSGFGVTSDSPSLFYAGDRHLYWLFHLFKPNALNFLAADPADFHSQFFRFPEPWDPVHYPVFPGFVAAITGAIFGPNGLRLWSPIDAHQLGLALLQSANLYLFARYAISLFGLIAGASASLFLAFFPCILGHAINNAKDLPCTLLYGIALLAAARGLLRRSPRDLLWSGFFAGVGLSCKLNEVFGLLTLVAWTPLAYGLFLRRERPEAPRAELRWLLALSYGLPLAAIAILNLFHVGLLVWLAAGTVTLFLPLGVDLLRRRGAASWRLIAAYVAIPLVAVVTFFALWPWLWAGEALTFSRRLGMYAEGMIRFSVSAREGFTGYPLRCVLFMTPPLVLLAAVLGGLTGWRGRRAGALFALLAAWLALPLLRIAVPHSMFYDANRHFLEYVPPLCLFAGLGIEAAVGFCRARGPTFGRVGSWGLGAACALALAIPIITYHPFEVTYFNWLAGGLGGAQRDALLFVPGEDWRSPGTEGDYWHASLRDFLDHVGPIVPPSAVLSTCGTMYLQAVSNWQGPPLRFVDAHEKGDYLYVAPREGFCGWADIRDLESLRPVLYRLTRGGGLIYEILGPAAGYPLPPVSPRTRYDPPFAIVDAS